MEGQVDSPGREVVPSLPETPREAAAVCETTREVATAVHKNPLLVSSCAAENTVQVAEQKEKTTQNMNNEPLGFTMKREVSFADDIALMNNQYPHGRIGSARPAPHYMRSAKRISKTSQGQREVSISSDWQTYGHGILRQSIRSRERSNTDGYASESEIRQEFEFDINIRLKGKVVSLENLTVDDRTASAKPVVLKPILKRTASRRRTNRQARRMTEVPPVLVIEPFSDLVYITHDGDGEFATELPDGDDLGDAFKRIEMKDEQFENDDKKEEERKPEETASTEIEEITSCDADDEDESQREVENRIRNSHLQFEKLISPLRAIKIEGDDEFQNESDATGIAILKDSTTKRNKGSFKEKPKKHVTDDMQKTKIEETTVISNLQTDAKESTKIIDTVMSPRGVDVIEETLSEKEIIESRNDDKIYHKIVTETHEEDAYNKNTIDRKESELNDYDRNQNSDTSLRKKETFEIIRTNTDMANETISSTTFSNKDNDAKRNEQEDAGAIFTNGVTKPFNDDMEEDHRLPELVSNDEQSMRLVPPAKTSFGVRFDLDDKVKPTPRKAEYDLFHGDKTLSSVVDTAIEIQLDSFRESLKKHDLPRDNQSESFKDGYQQHDITKPDIELFGDGDKTEVQHRDKPPNNVHNLQKGSTVNHKDANDAGEQNSLYISNNESDTNITAQNDNDTQHINLEQMPHEEDGKKAYNQDRLGNDGTVSASGYHRQASDLETPIQSPRNSNNESMNKISHKILPNQEYIRERSRIKQKPNIKLGPFEQEKESDSKGLIPDTTEKSLQESKVDSTDIKNIAEDEPVPINDPSALPKGEFRVVDVDDTDVDDALRKTDLADPNAIEYTKQADEESLENNTVRTRVKDGKKSTKQNADKAHVEIEQKSQVHTFSQFGMQALVMRKSETLPSKPNSISNKPAFKTQKHVVQDDRKIQVENKSEKVDEYVQKNYPKENPEEEEKMESVDLMSGARLITPAMKRSESMAKLYKRSKEMEDKSKVTMSESSEKAQSKKQTTVGKKSVVSKKTSDVNDKNAASRKITSLQKISKNK